MVINRNNFNKFLFFIFILFSVEFAFLTSNKQAGIPYLREFFSLFVVFLALYLSFFRKFWIGTKYEIYILFYVLSWIVFSSLLAYFNHGQPIGYGIVEERRLLLFLVFYPVFYFLLYRITDFDEIGRYLLIAFLMTSLVGVMYSIGILQPRLDLSFSVGGRSLDDIQEIYEGFRGGRFTIGTNFIVWMFCFTLILYRTTGKFLWLILAVYVFWYTWHVVQTRTLLATIAICAIFIFRKRFDRLLLGVYLFSFVSLVIIVLVPDWIASQVEQFHFLLADVLEHSGPRTREITISVVMDEIMRNPLGYGALSLQWENGFLDVYNDNFYLSDVGVFGVVYRFGIVSVPMIFMFYYLYCSRAWFLRKDESPLVSSACYVVWVSLINFVFSSSMAMSGNLFGIILAVLAARLIIYQTDKISNRLEA